MGTCRVRLFREEHSLRTTVTQLTYFYLEQAFPSHGATCVLEEGDLRCSLLFAKALGWPPLETL